MLSFGDVLGQPAAVSFLERLLSAGRLPPALLLHGPDGVGKALLARVVAEALICEDPQPTACGRCTSCGMLEHQGHPDLVYVRRLERDEDPDHLVPENSGLAEDELRREILIDQIRHVIELVPLLPRSGRHRVVIIDPADHMNDEAQNALLKTLEEPPARSVILLVAASKHRLLPTVRSRCSAVPLRLLRSADLARILIDRGLPRDEALARAALAGGRVGPALELEVGARRQQRDELLDMLVRLATDRRAVERLPEMAQALAGRTERTLTDSLDLVETLLRDAARIAVHSGGESLIHRDVVAGLTRLGQGLGARRSADLIGACGRLRSSLRYNTNRTLIAESLLAAAAGGPVP